jgi:DNA-3-methyladenine glycosylase
LAALAGRTGPAPTPAGSRGAPLARAFFARSVHEVAPDLIGATLLVDGVGGVVVEVEAYAPDDPASHSFRGPTARNAAMFGPPGHAYVYRSYGIHWCLNVVCCEPGVGAAVLLRALEPAHGIREMRARRQVDGDLLLCAGPGRLTEALGVTGRHDRLALDAAPFALRSAPGPVEVAQAPRIGITRAADLPWRYALAGSPYVSRPLPSRSRSRTTARRRG